jgi:hypothetical protein
MSRGKKKEPAPITITPTATPSSCLAEDYESCRREGIHVRVVENGRRAGLCWCGGVHVAVAGVRLINVTTR